MNNIFFKLYTFFLIKGTLESLSSTMTSALEKVIKDIDALDSASEKITGIVADVNMAWALELTDKLGIKGAVFCPASAAVLVLGENIPNLIQDGIINTEGKAIFT